VRWRGGAARRRSLPRRAVDRALAAGRLVAPRRGWVAVADLHPALLTALSLGGVLSCGAAAQAHGLELIDPSARPHVTVPRGWSLSSTREAVVHRRDVPALDGVTTLARTAADCARCLPRRDAIVVVDGVLSRGIDVEDVRAHLRGRGAGGARARVERASPLAGSSGETCARIAPEDAGFDVECQVHIPTVGWVDLLVDGTIVVEVDGFAHHSDPRQFAADRRRDAALAARGYVVLRFAWADAVRRPDYLVATVQAARRQVG
jgi:hypothetical protein